ncbi:neuromedin-B receptor-like [Periplaneta americana]|uniref:neuromedin-B receptor-like n=1 Tax=Periplaneta americana TaxID=6978 RepID=UPI0037E96C5A
MLTLLLCLMNMAFLPLRASPCRVLPDYPTAEVKTNAKNSSYQQESESYVITVMKEYLDPAVYFLYIAVGLVWNCTLVLIFVRHEEIRTASNIMIFNLAVCDILNLGIGGTFQYINFYVPHLPVDTCRDFIATRVLLRTASALSLLALSVQRCCVTLSYFRQKPLSCCSSVIFTSLYILTVWLIAASISIPTLLWEIYGFICSTYNDEYPNKLLALIYFMFYCLVMPTLMCLFNCLTAWRLKHSAKVPGELRNKPLEQVRNRSATVVMCLGIMMVFCYFPYELWCLITFWTDSGSDTALAQIILIIAKYLLFADACFNPIALYIISRTYRKLFRRYLCFVFICVCNSACQYKEEEEGEEEITYITRL